MLWVWIGAERRCHQTAHKKMTALSVAAQGDTLISFVIDEAFQYALLFVLLAFDAPQVADKIARVAVYLSPFLRGQIWYGFYGYHPLSYMFEKCDEWIIQV